MTTNLIKDTEFKQWLINLKVRIRQSQLKAAIKVNDEMLRLYWELGRDIAVRQMDAKWGSGFYLQLSKELKSEFPEMKGFSTTNLKYCKYFYQFYSQDNQIRPQAGDELQAIENDLAIIRPQVVDELGNTSLFLVPWGHQRSIIDKCKSVHEALFYVQKTIKNGWSRAVLMNFMEADLYRSQGKAITNFDRLLPDVQVQTEHTGKLGYYIAAVNHQLKKDIDNPTIGMLIVKKKNNIDAQYSLESSSQPIGISEYTLSKLLPENFKSSLPSIKEIERELNKDNI